MKLVKIYANGSPPKSTESGQRLLCGPAADLSFLLAARGLCIETAISAKKTALTPNGRRCAFPLKCGQITNTTAGHLTTMGALQPSSNITEQATRCPWLLYTMIHHISARCVPPPSLPCAMPSWTIACRVWHCTAPWHALPMRIPYTYDQGSCNIMYTYTRLLRSTHQKANSTGSCH